ncbi:aspartyl protease-like protein, partial [Aphelenchoides avenae]
FRLGTYHTSATLVATVSQGSKARAPSDIFEAVVSVIDAEYDFASDEYVVECGRVQSLPPLVVDFDDFAYLMPPSDYVKNLVPRKDNKCTLLIEESQGDLIRIFDMGWQMLKGYCWMFDYGKDELAFAKANR